MAIVAPGLASSGSDSTPKAASWRSRVGRWVREVAGAPGKIRHRWIGMGRCRRRRRAAVRQFGADSRMDGGGMSSALAQAAGRMGWADAPGRGTFCGCRPRGRARSRPGLSPAGARPGPPDPRPLRVCSRGLHKPRKTTETSMTSTDPFPLPRSSLWDGPWRQPGHACGPGLRAERPPVGAVDDPGPQG